MIAVSLVPSLQGTVIKWFHLQDKYITQLSIRGWGGAEMVLKRPKAILFYLYLNGSGGEGRQLACSWVGSYSLQTFETATTELCRHENVLGGNTSTMG